MFLSGRPGSNRRHSAWKADALPTELLPPNFHTFKGMQIYVFYFEIVGRAVPMLRENLRILTFHYKYEITTPTHRKNLQSLTIYNCGKSRIRTCEDIVSRFTVCPRWPLEYLPNIISIKFKNYYLNSEPIEGLPSSPLGINFSSQFLFNS